MNPYQHPSHPFLEIAFHFSRAIFLISQLVTMLTAPKIYGNSRQFLSRLCILNFYFQSKNNSITLLLEWFSMAHLEAGHVCPNFLVKSVKWVNNRLMLTFTEHYDFLCERCAQPSMLEALLALCCLQNKWLWQHSLTRH